MHCRAIIHTADGEHHRCCQPLVKDAASGLPVCYLHDKYATGDSQPIPTDWKPEKVTGMTVMSIDFIFPEDPYTDEPWDGSEVAELPKSA